MMTGPYLEALLVVLVLFQEGGVVDYDLSVGNAQVEDLVVNRLRGFDRADRLFEVDVEGPKLERFEQAGLDRERLVQPLAWIG